MRGRITANIFYKRFKSSKVKKLNKLGIMKYFKLLVALCSLTLSVNSCSCSSDKKSTGEVFPKDVVFKLEEETGFDWNSPMTDVHKEMESNKTFKDTASVDNHVPTDLSKIGAFAADLINAYLGSETNFFEQVSNSSYSDGPLIICGPIIYRHIKFDIATYWSGKEFAGDKPMMDVATLSSISYFKKYEDEDDHEKADNDYKKLEAFFDATCSLERANDNWKRWSNGVTQISLYRTEQEEGWIFKDNLPVIYLVFERI